jgi:hypothetical protein
MRNRLQSSAMARKRSGATLRSEGAAVSGLNNAMETVALGRPSSFWLRYA